MNTTILILIALGSLLLLLLTLYLVLLSPSAQERRTLGRQAGLDFRNARGTAHLKLMRDARRQLSQAQTQCQASLDRAKKRRAECEASRDRKLRVALDEYTLKHRLREISGIGENLAWSLEYYAKQHGGISALRRAEGNISGIGPARQAAIEFWVAAYQSQVPKLLAEPFPGKAEIEQAVAKELGAMSEEIEKLTAEHAAITAKLDRLRTEIEPLERVRRKSLYEALRNPGAVSEDLERYLRGVFGEWEPVPTGSRKPSREWPTDGEFLATSLSSSSSRSAQA